MTKTIEVEVTSCYDCPFKLKKIVPGDSWHFCIKLKNITADKAGDPMSEEPIDMEACIIDQYINERTTPEWCPVFGG